jgi:hypothetical protein
MQPGDTECFGSVIIDCHLGDNGRYINIYDNNELCIGTLDLIYDNDKELADDLFEIIF